MKNLPVRKKFEYDKIHSFRDVNPFTICFVYTQIESFIVKGGLNDVAKYLKTLIHPMIVHYTFWHHKRKRGYIKFKNFNNKKFSILKMYDDKTFKYLHYHTLYIYTITEGYREIKRFKRVPRKWIKELDQFV